MGMNLEKLNVEELLDLAALMVKSNPDFYSRDRLPDIIIYHLYAHRMKVSPDIAMQMNESLKNYQGIGLVEGVWV